MLQKKISVTSCRHHGRKMWRVRWTELGRVRRKFFHDRDGAEAHAVTLRGDQLGVNDFWATLSQPDRERVFTIWQEALRRDIDLMALVVQSQDDAAPVHSPLCRAVLDELMQVKIKGGLSKDYIGSLGHIIGRFCQQLGRRPMNMVRFAEVEKFRDGYNLASRPTVRSRLATWFKFAVRRGYCPVNLCEQLDPVKVPYTKPRIFTVAETAACLEWLKVRPRAAAWFVLTTFAGLRPEEAMQTSWHDIHFADGWIRVEPQTSKLRERRVVAPRPGVLKYLQWVKKRKARLPLTVKQLTIERWALLEHLQWAEWPQDVTRHTAASMWLAAESDAALVAHQLGHSEKILHSKYKAVSFADGSPLTRAGAEKFWALLTS